MVNKTSFIIISLFLVIPNVYSQSSTARFLYWSPSAEAMGMGGTGVSSVDNPFAVYYNPAGLAFSNRLNISASYVKPFSTFSNTIHSQISISFPISSVGSFSVSANTFWIEPQIRTSSQGPDPLGTTSPNSGNSSPKHYQIKLSYANVIDKNMSFGLSFSILNIGLTDLPTENENGDGNTTSVLFDGGMMITDIFPEATYYSTGGIKNRLLDNKSYSGFSFGLSFLNIGPKISFIDEDQNDDPPSRILLGVTYWPVFTDLIGSRLSIDMEKRIYDSDQLDFINFGSEALIYRLLSLRCGYNKSLIQNQKSYFTFGFGAKLKFLSLNVSRYNNFLLPSWHFDTKISLEL